MNRQRQIDTLLREIEDAMGTAGYMPEEYEFANKVFRLLHKARELIYAEQEKLEENQ